MMGGKVSDEASRSIKPLEGSRSRVRRTRSIRPGLSDRRNLTQPVSSWRELDYLRPSGQAILSPESKKAELSCGGAFSTGVWHTSGNGSPEAYLCSNRAPVTLASLLSMVCRVWRFHKPRSFGLILPSVHFLDGA